MASCVISPDTYSTRWEAMLNKTTGMKAGDYLLIDFGINDGDATCPRHVGLALFESSLGAMATAAKAMGVNPIFLTPTSAIECSGSVAQPTRGAYVGATITAGTTYNVPVIDLDTMSINLYNQLDFCPNNGNYTEGAVGAFFCNDHTHFEKAGASQIADLVVGALRTQNIPLAAWLK